MSGHPEVPRPGRPGRGVLSRGRRGVGVRCRRWRVLSPGGAARACSPSPGAGAGAARTRELGRAGRIPRVQRRCEGLPSVRGQEGPGSRSPAPTQVLTPLWLASPGQWTQSTFWRRVSPRVPGILPVPPYPSASLRSPRVGEGAGSGVASPRSPRPCTRVGMPAVGTPLPVFPGPAKLRPERAWGGRRWVRSE